MQTSDRAAVDFWLDELEHRADHPDDVRVAAAVLTRPGHEATVHDGDLVGRLCGLDPWRDRPRLDDDPDGAVLIDILLTPLGRAPQDYAGVSARDVLERLLHGDSIYATPECRVRLEGRARYNLAFDLARRTSQRFHH